MASIVGFSAWTISPASAGTKFWSNNDSLKTPSGNKTNFSLSNIDTPQLFTNFWSNNNNNTDMNTGLDTPKLLDDVTKKAEAEDSDFVDLDCTKAAEVSNLDIMPPTPKQAQVAHKAGPVSSITEQTRREVNLGDYSIVQETHVSLIPNNMLNKNTNLPVLQPPPRYNQIKNESEGPSAAKRRLVQMPTPNTIHQNFKLESIPVKVEANQSSSAPVSPKTKGKKQPKEKKYACNWENCTKAFYRADELKRHTRVHTKEKPFPCPHCDRHFARSDHVRTHVRIHTGEKPYKCKYCPKSFARSDERLRHHKVHEKRTKKEQDAKNNQRKMEVMGYQNVCQSRASTPNSHCS